MLSLRNPQQGLFEADHLCLTCAVNPDPSTQFGLCLRVWSRRKSRIACRGQKSIRIRTTRLKWMRWAKVRQSETDQLLPSYSGYATLYFQVDS